MLKVMMRWLGVVLLMTTLSYGDGSFDESFDDEFSQPAAQQSTDLLEGYNRFMTKINDKFYLILIKPSAKLYAVVLPQPLQESISHFYDNIKTPIYFTNALLQLKLKKSAKELSRFIINSTLGLLGFFDVAQKMGIESKHEDFGQTLGVWGVGAGPHVVLPIFGPSNLRDMVGMMGDFTLDPTSNLAIIPTLGKQPIDSISLETLRMLNAAALHKGELESLKADVMDWYLFLKESYETKRRKDIDE